MNDNLHPVVITFITGNDNTPVESRYSMAINAILKPEQINTVKALMDSMITTIRSFDEGNFRESQAAVENRTDAPTLQPGA